MFLRNSLTVLVFIIFSIITISCSKDSSTEPTNNPPEIQSISATPSSLNVTETTILTCTASDKDGDNLIYTWSADNGTFPDGISDYSVKWKAPDFQGTYKINVIVNDGTESVTGNIDVLVGKDGEPCPESPTVFYGGKNYNTVKIGTQCWLKENLDIDNVNIEKYCYDNNPIYCQEYGGLYTWDEAMQYNSITEKNDICPIGWHIPTLDEFQVLYDKLDGDGNALKEIGQGEGIAAGTNTSGFSALLTGPSFT